MDGNSSLHIETGSVPSADSPELQPNQPSHIPDPLSHPKRLSLGSQGSRNSQASQSSQNSQVDPLTGLAIGLEIETPTSDINPWGDISTPPNVTTSPAHVPPSAGSNSLNEEFHIKPIRLMKRQQEKRLSSSSISSAPPVPSPSKHRSPSSSSKQPVKVDEFQCRPIRLGSSGRKRDSRVSLNSGITRTESDVSSSNSQEVSGLTGAAGLGAITSNTSGSRPGSTRSSTSSTGIIDNRSIQIKNLPIVPQPPPHLKNDSSSDMIFAICVVDFHHQRGPEVQWWKSNYHSSFGEGLFKNLSFQALPDGSHLFEETFSNFNLVYDFKSGKSIDDLKDLNQFQGDPRDLRTLFGCSCVRQVKTSDLSKEELDRNKDFTRSIVQKAVVVIARKQPIFTKIKEKLSIVTRSYFQQDDFQNIALLENLFENLNTNFKLVDNELEVLAAGEASKEQKDLTEEEEFFVNLNLKTSILKFKTNFMIIFKALLLDKKIIIYSNNNLEVLTQFQNNLISLIPNLINNLDNSGCPLIDFIETNGPLAKPNSLNTNNRKSLLRFFGLPLQIFNTKSSFWNPYLPLQQLDELSVDSYMIGCSNLLFINQAEKFGVDLVVNLDTNEITYPSNGGVKREELSLSSNDKKFINNLISNMNSHSDEFIGNDDYIRYQFEDYLSSLISTMRFSQYVDKFNQAPPGFVVNGTDPNSAGVGDIGLFNKKFIEAWRLSQNFKIWNAMADEFIFNFIEPKHLGVDIVETNQAYKNISNFFNNLKFKPVGDSTEVVENKKAQKFIPEEESEENASATDRSNNARSSSATSRSGTKEDLEHEGYENISETDVQSVTKKLSNWTSGWGFKKK